MYLIGLLSCRLTRQHLLQAVILLQEMPCLPAIILCLYVPSHWLIATFWRLMKLFPTSTTLHAPILLINTIWFLKLWHWWIQLASSGLLINTALMVCLCSGSLCTAHNIVVVRRADSGQEVGTSIPVTTIVPCKTRFPYDKGSVSVVLKASFIVTGGRDMNERQGGHLQSIQVGGRNLYPRDILCVANQLCAIYFLYITLFRGAGTHYIHLY